METLPASPRRSFLAKSSAAVAAIVASLNERFSLAEEAAKKEGVSGKIHHSVSRWCFKSFSLDDLCTAVKEFGVEAIDLLDPSDFETVRKHDMYCPMVSAPSRAIEVDGKKKNIGSIPHGLNRLENHDILLEIYEPLLKASADAGFRNVICFSGNRDGMDDEQGLKNCVIGIKRLLPLCEKHGITLTMELLNSKRNHKDYMCDLSSWGAELCQAVGSESFKLLYDIYHMQIMEGDVIDTIRERHQYFSHYHTGGVPGRGEIDDTQELHYPAIMRAIVETGYQGWVGQEFVPKRPDKLQSLRQAIEICSV